MYGSECELITAQKIWKGGLIAPFFIRGTFVEHTYIHL